MKILNLTQHIATPAQLEAGVVEPISKEIVRNLLTFRALPTSKLLERRAKNLAELAKNEGFSSVMIGGAAYLISRLEYELVMRDMKVFYAFTLRESVETINQDNSITKKSIFRHIGFVEADYSL